MAGDVSIDLNGAGHAGSIPAASTTNLPVSTKPDFDRYGGGRGYVRPISTITCAFCGGPHTIRQAEHDRRLRKNPHYQFYCSLKCVSDGGGKHNLGVHLGLGHPESLNAGNRKDDLSGFRYLLNKARNRKKHEPTDLDLPYLKELWDSQDGRCVISGIEMILPSTSLAWTQDTHNPWKPSLDRIDSSKGYMKGNVRFVTVMANFCKQRYPDEDVIAFCRAVAAAHPSV